LCDSGNVCVRQGFSDIELYGTSWEVVPSVDGDALQISVGENYQTWMINGHNVYYRAGMTPNDIKGTDWVQVGSEGNIQWLDVGENLVYAIDDQDEIWQRTGINEQGLAGASWQKVPGHMVQLSLYQRSVAWAVDRDHRLWMRRVDIGSDPVPVDETDLLDGCHKMVETTKDSVFLVDCSDNLYWRTGVTDQQVLGESWVLMDTNV